MKILNQLAYLSKDKYDITYLSYDQYLEIENLLVVENYYSDEASAKDYLVENSITPELHNVTQGISMRLNQKVN